MSIALPPELYELSFMFPSPPANDADKLTPEQVKQFEYEHKLLFIYLAITNNTYCNLFNKEFKKWFNSRDKNSKQTFLETPRGKIVANLGRVIRVKAKAWFDTQLYLEKTAHIPKVSVTLDDFLHDKKNLAILTQGSAWTDKSGHVSGVKGIGIIPLIIWGIVLVVSAISAAYIIHRLTTTTQDRKDLLLAAEQTCKDLNLTPDECANVVTTTQKEESNNAKGVTDTVTAVSSGLSSVMLLLLAGGALLIFSKSKST